ncbi:MAG: TrmH family RNA methyltransferase [Clostridiales bacterium]|nr:TrmH family RNA methyltransferase [Clostridiales bacterium]
MPPLERYTRQLPYAYALGLYPALEALQRQPRLVSRVLLHSALGEGEGARALRDLCARHSIRTEQADRLLRRLSGKDNCYAAAVFHKQQADPDPARSHLVLVHPMDAGNLGTILRTAAGLGYQDIALIRPCADVYDPQVVRASMGALFSLRVSEYDSFDSYRAQAGDRAWYPFMLSPAARPLREVARLRQSPHSLVFGNEGSGLDPVFAQLGQPVCIEQSAAVDSLNLAVAAALGMYSFSPGAAEE